MDKAERDEIRQRIDSSRPEDDDALSEVNIMALLDALDSADDRVAALKAQIEKRSKSALSCGFCGKTQNEVAKLISGPQCYICNECVSVCAALIPLGELIRPLIGNTTEVSLTADEIVKFIDKLKTEPSVECES